MTLRTRILLASCAIVSAIAWLFWVLSGMTGNRFEGWHDLFEALILGMVPSGLLLAAAGDVKLRPLRQYISRLLKNRRKTNSAEARLTQAIGSWMAFLLVVMFLASHGKDIGTWGDSFNILTCLFIAVGFYYTVKQIRHSEETASKATALQIHLWRTHRLESKIASVKAEELELRKDLERLNDIISSVVYLRTEIQGYRLTERSNGICSWDFRHYIAELGRVLEIIEMEEIGFAGFAEIGIILTQIRSAVDDDADINELVSALDERADIILASGVGPASIRVEQALREKSGMLTSLEHFLEKLVLRDES